MKDREFQIVDLAPMSVVAAHAVGVSPEARAWERLYAWAEPLGLLQDMDRHPVYGFNNPNPEPGQQEYGYEFWLVVDEDVTDAGELELKRFPGGIFAVTRCKLIGDSAGSIPEIWRRLYEQVQASGGYCWRRDQELEKIVNPGAPQDEILLDLYLPVREKTTAS